MSSMAPHAFTLRQLQYIVAVAELRNFRAAAATCRVSQPSLSSQLAQVEAQLGVRLFERDRRHVLPTTIGERIVARARALLVAADDLADAATRARDPLAGTLRLGVIHTVAPYLLPEIAASLGKAYPRARIVWVENKTETLLEQLRRGELDAAIVAGESELGDVETAAIGRDPFLLAVGPRHALARGARPIDAHTLDEAELLVLTEGHCLRDQVIAACTRRGHDEAPFGATSLATLASMVAAGDGVTLLPQLALPVENRRGQLHVRRLKHAPGRTLVLAWRRGGAVEPAARALAATMREQYARLATRLQRIG